jgi:hypothetical protein
MPLRSTFPQSSDIVMPDINENDLIAKRVLFVPTHNHPSRTGAIAL